MLKLLSINILWHFNKLFKWKFHLSGISLFWLICHVIPTLESVCIDCISAWYEWLLWSLRSHCFCARISTVQRPILDSQEKRGSVPWYQKLLLEITILHSFAGLSFQKLFLVLEICHHHSRSICSFISYALSCLYFTYMSVLKWLIHWGKSVLYFLLDPCWSTHWWFPDQ